MTFTATVIPTPTGSSPGTVTFLNGTTPLTTANLNSAGVATFTSSALESGSLSLTATYSGNATLSASTSTVVSETVNAVYAVVAPQTLIPAAEGASVNVNLSVPPLGGPYNNTVTLSASGLPPGVTITFTPPTVTPGNGGATTLMTIQLPRTIASVPPSREWPILPGPLSLTLAMCGVLYGYRRRKLLRFALVTLILAGAMTTLMGCNGGLSGPMVAPGNYVITITGASGTLHESTTVTLVVQ